MKRRLVTTLKWLGAERKRSTYPNNSEEKGRVAALPPPMRMPDFQPIELAAPPAVCCRIGFAATAATIQAGPAAPSLAVALPVLAGPGGEIILAGGTADQRDGCVVIDGGNEVAGFTVAPAELGLEAAARELYRRAFAAIDARQFCRVWNYVPEINRDSDGLENYRRFCRGRSMAFEEHFGRRFQRELPAASAVGTTAGPLAIAFLATKGAPRHFENPCQVPAFEYPPDYGPRPPSFSRASVATIAGRHTVFLSGTAAIRGHVTVGPHDLEAQMPCTLENLQLIAAAAGAGPVVGAAEGFRRSFKVFLRERRDLDRARSFLERHLLQPDDGVTYLEAGICRADLRIEIEAVLTR